MESVKETGLLLPRDILEGECDSDARGKDDTLNRKAIPRFHNPCSSKLLQPLLLISILLLFSNAIFAAKYFRARQQPPCQSRSSYTDLEISLQSMRPSLTSALYTSPNITEANLAWESIQTSYAVVALKSRWVQEHDLAASMLSPTDPTKYVYILEAYHVLHCVKSLRRTYLDLVAGVAPEMPQAHILHCFNALRQHVICSADDTLLSTWGGDSTAGMDSSRACKDWDALEQWASDHTACYNADPSQGEPYWGTGCAG